MRARAVDLLCSPNAHTRSIVFLERRYSSKRAVGDQTALTSYSENGPGPGGAAEPVPQVQEAQRNCSARPHSEGKGEAYVVEPLNDARMQLSPFQLPGKA